MITPQEISRYMRSSRPFSIFLADGREITVPHGEFLYVNPESARFVVETPDATESFSFLMVTSIKQDKRTPAKPLKQKP